MSRHIRTVLLRSVAAVSAVVLLSIEIPTAVRATPGRPTAKRPATPTAAMPPSTAESAIARREYEVSESDFGLQAPNRANGLRTYFDARGARIVDREDGTEIARLETASIGRGCETRAVSAGEVSASGARVEVRRAGVVEWFENTSAGLEHGWTLEARPEGDGPLAIEIEVAGARVDVEGDRAALVGGGRRLEYGAVAALDATGRSVAASLELGPAGRMRIVVDDANATYPLTIDPTLAQPLQTGPPSAESTIIPNADAVLQSDQAESQFGLSVAGAGDVNNDGYDDVIVGAAFYDTGAVDAGAAFVFHGGVGSVADGNPANANAVLESDQNFSRFGASVAGVGDVNGDGYDDVIVGATGYTVNGVTSAAFVFHGGPNGIGNHNPLDANAVLTSNQANAGLGRSVSGAGDVNGDGYDDVIVGASSYSVNPAEGLEGLALVFHGGPAGVGNGNPANADGSLAGDFEEEELGAAVAGAGDVNDDGFDDVIVGADGFGAAFVLHGGAPGVGHRTPEDADATLTSDLSFSSFGQALAGVGDVNGDGFDDVIVGSGIYVPTGAAFIFHGGPVGVGNGGPANADAVLLGDPISNSFGRSVSGAGDIDGDGFDDVIVGDPAYNGKGGAFVFHGGAAGVGNGGPANADAAYLSDQVNGQMGTSVAGIGDTNGDFSADVAVGAPTYSLGQLREGAVFIFVGPVLAAGSGADTPGVYAGASGAWFLRNMNSPGPADLAFPYGAGGSGLVPLKGDWNGDSLDTPGVYDPATSTFFLENASAPGPANITFAFGAPGLGYVPIAGDWDNNGTDTVGLYQPTTSTFFLTNINGPGPAGLVFAFGAPGLGYVPIAGDWDDNGTDTVGLYLPSSSTFFLRNATTAGPADVTFSFGAAGVGYLPLAGDYDGDGRDTVGLYDPASGAFFLTNANVPGPAALVFVYGGPNLTPLVGDWNAL